MNDRIYCLLNDPDNHPHPQQSPLRQVTEEETIALRKQEATATYRLTPKLASQREKLVATLLENGKRYLQLRDKTVELCIRVFDFYCHRVAEGFTFDGKKVGRSEKGRWLLQRKEEALLSAVTCIFTCSKYNQIYPPALSDIIFVFGDKFTKTDIIRRENEILHVTDFGFEISSISRWFEHYFTNALPSWLMDCYLKCYGEMEEVAKVVRELSVVEENSVSSTIAGRVSIAQKVVTLLSSKDEKTHKQMK